MSTQSEGERTNALFPMDRILYKAAVEADLHLLLQFIQSLGPTPNEVRVNIDTSTIESSPLLATTFGGNTMLHLVAGNAKQTNLEFAQTIFNTAPVLLREPYSFNKLGETLLHLAARTNNPKMVSLLISLAKNELESEEYLKFIRKRRLNGGTALHEAVSVRNEKIVEELLMSDAELARIVGNNGVSPLYVATMNNFELVVRSFVKRARANTSFAVGSKGQTALHAAVLDNIESTQDLLEWDPKLATEVDEDGNWPLHYAASVGNVDTINILLKYDISAVYKPNKDGMIPAQIAAKMGHENVVRKLAKFDELCDEEGEGNEFNGGNNVIVKMIRVLIGFMWIYPRKLTILMEEEQLSFS